MTDQNRFEALADIDVDGAAFQVGLSHYAFSPSRAGFRFNAGAVEVIVNVHHTDIDEMIKALRRAKNALAKKGI